MEPDAIAEMLSIGVGTVAAYVLLAIKCERLAFNERRARALVPHVSLKWMRDDFKAMISSRVSERNGIAQMKEGARSIKRVGYERLRGR